MPSKQPTQKQLAQKAGLSQQRISQFVREGIIIQGEDPDESIRKIIRHQGESAAGRQPQNGEVDRVLEAALLDRAKREEIEIRIAEKQGKLISDDVFVDGVAATFAALKSRLLGLPNKLRAANPRWTQADTNTCDDVIREFLSELSGDRFPRHIRARLETSRARAEARTPANGKSVGRLKPQTQHRK
jgi:phage terminase Nu1 subunit (DNA packaging protein)